jgi:hypothetical protein
MEFVDRPDELIYSHYAYAYVEGYSHKHNVERFVGLTMDVVWYPADALRIAIPSDEIWTWRQRI